MKLEDGYSNLEWSKKLKALGVRQESEFCWSIMNHNPLETQLAFGNLGRWDSKLCTAFSVAELGVVLPVRYEKGGIIRVVDSHRNADGEWSLNFREVDVITKKTRSLNCEKEPNEANARAAMLCYLLENSIIKVSEVNERLAA